MSYLVWCTIAIGLSFLIGVIVTVVQDGKINVLKPRYRKKH